MSEYQYYEFLAIERPLSAEDRAEIRRISTRAKITETSFVNEYSYGDFKGDPIEFMRRWFDIHIYLANWGSRQLIIRLPKQLADVATLRRFECDFIKIVETDEHAIVDLDVPSDGDAYDFIEDDGWMARLTPLRDDILAGDLRRLYLVWIYAVWLEGVADDAIEPMAGAGPLSPRLAEAVAFFGFTDELVQLATERVAPGVVDRGPADVRVMIEALSEKEKLAFLVRVAEGDLRVATELRVLAQREQRPSDAPEPGSLLTAAELYAKFEPWEE